MPTGPLDNAKYLGDIYDRPLEAIITDWNKYYTEFSGKEKSMSLSDFTQIMNADESIKPAVREVIEEYYGLNGKEHKPIDVLAHQVAEAQGITDSQRAIETVKNRVRFVLVQVYPKFYFDIQLAYK